MNESFPSVPNRSVLKITPSGPIVIETGSDGVYLRYECDCKDALPFCKSACCSLSDISVKENEREGIEKAARKVKPKLQLPVVVKDDEEEGLEMVRSSDSWCACLDRTTRSCKIYKDRPETCQVFHCTLGSGNRGWRLDLNRLDGVDE